MSLITKEQYDKSKNACKTLTILLVKKDKTDKETNFINANFKRLFAIFYDITSRYEKENGIVGKNLTVFQDSRGGDSCASAIR